MRIAICDDDNEFRQVIAGYLKPYKILYPEITENNFNSGEELVNYYNNGRKADILFLDIKMKDANGIETAKNIREMDKDVIIIFVTGYTEFVPDTFRVGAFQFLLKPVDESDFKRDFERAVDFYKISRFKYKVNWKDTTAVVEIKDICYIEASNRHLFICTSDARLECVGRIAEEEKKLAGYNIIKCHQSYLINLAYVQQIVRSKVFLTGGRHIPVSRKHKETVKASFNSYLTGCCI